MCGCGGGAARPRMVIVGGRPPVEVKDFRLRPARKEAVLRVKARQQRQVNALRRSTLWRG